MVRKIDSTKVVQTCTVLDLYEKWVKMRRAQQTLSDGRGDLAPELADEQKRDG